MSAHLDISAELLVSMFTEGSHHDFSVSPGLEPGTVVDDVTYDPFTKRIRLHFDRTVIEPILHAHRRPEALSVT